MRIRFFHTESFRLAAIYAAIFAVSMAALSYSVLVITDAALRDQILQFSRADIAAVRDGYVHEGLHEAREVTVQRMAGGGSDFILLEQRGTVLAGNLAAMPARLGAFEMADPRGGGQPVLGYGEMLAPGLYAFSGSGLDYVQVVRAHLIRVLAWLFAGALLLAAAGGLIASRGFLARTDAIARTCRAIMAGNLKDRIPVRGQDELDRLAVTVNAMLDRITALMENLRQVSNDIAHDLRTPLAHLRQRLERARAQAHSPAEFAAALDGAVAASDEMLSLFAALLRIAQIEGGSRRAGFGPVDLAALLRRLREVYGAVAEDGGHRLVVVEAAASPIQGDSELLFQLLANLVENALMHTPPGTAVRVALRADAGQTVIMVEDDGPGIPPDAREKVLQRFYRLDASRSKPGHGLGLALVVAIAELHEGKVTVGTGPQERGLRIAIALGQH